jgi:hypothetical protein
MLIPCSWGEASEPQRGVAVAAAAAAAMAIVTIACEAEGKEKDEALGPQRQSCYVPPGYVTRSPGTYNRRVVIFSLYVDPFVLPCRSGTCFVLPGMIYPTRMNFFSATH